MIRKFTTEELAGYNGRNGKPAYLGYKGKVYDVSGVFKNGEHAGVKAGYDITGSFHQGPHQEDIFTKFPVVGVIRTETSFLQKVLQGSSQQADLIIRVGLGLVFFAHGAQKLLGWFGGYGWAGTVQFFNTALGIPTSLAGLAILIEFFAGIAIILGLFTRPAALGLAVVSLFAALKVHLANGFFLDQKGPADGIEYVFILFTLSLYLLVKGSGSISLDKVLSEKLS